MPAFELRLDGHSTGLACAMAARLEDRLSFAAFKMGHPLEVRSSVILDSGPLHHTASAYHVCASACATACDDIGSDLRSLLAQLPVDPHSKERFWPERAADTPLEVLLRPRKVTDEA